MCPTREFVDLAVISVLFGAVGMSPNREFTRICVSFTAITTTKSVLMLLSRYTAAVAVCVLLLLRDVSICDYNFIVRYGHYRRCCCIRVQYSELVYHCDRICRVIYIYMCRYSCVCSVE